MADTGAGKKVEQEAHPPAPLIVIEQWLCLALGIVCAVSGLWGIVMKLGPRALSAHLAWSERVYVPMLRITAAVCVVMGVILLRLGFAHHERRIPLVSAHKQPGEEANERRR